MSEVGVKEFVVGRASTRAAERSIIGDKTTVYVSAPVTAVHVKVGRRLGVAPEGVCGVGAAKQSSGKILATKALEERPRPRKMGWRATRIIGKSVDLVSPVT
jgi:hypothetical protein